MNYTETMAALKAAGSEQTRKTYLRHGADTELFGVSYADLYKLAKKAGTDQPLAERLWASGNHDARVLATHVADSAAIPSRTLEAWIRESTNYILADAVATLTVRAPHAPAMAERWTGAKEEYVCCAGWTVVAGLAMTGAAAAGRAKKQESPAAAGFDDATAAAYLGRIEREIGSAKNRVKHAMNNAVICIGLRGGAIRDQAIATAKRIGKVEVDHGQTGCKTPDAVEYIRKVEARSAASAGKTKPAPAAKGAGGGGAKAKKAPPTVRKAASPRAAARSR